jgi:IS5 family transposase
MMSCQKNKSQGCKKSKRVVNLQNKGCFIKEREHSDEFKRARKQHSAVESAINALEVHGLDVCPDHGIDGFKRYVALAVVARNIQRLGILIRQHAQEKAHALQKKQQRLKRAA